MKMVDISKKEPTIKIKVCTGINCAFRGASHLIDVLFSETDILEYCEIIEAPCVNEICEHSQNSPVVFIDDECFLMAKPEIILDELYKKIQTIRDKS